MASAKMGNDEGEDDMVEEQEPAVLRRAFLTQSLGVLIRRPLWGALSWTTLGLVAGRILGRGALLLRTTLYAEALFLLGPLGAARGALSATREVIVDSGVAANAGRDVYETALSIVEDDKESSSGNLREAIATLKESYPMTTALIEGKGFVGWLARRVAGFFLPNPSVVFEQIEEAIAWSEKQAETLEDAEVVAQATESIIEVYIREKEDFVTTVGLCLYSVIAGVAILIF